MTANGLVKWVLEVIKFHCIRRGTNDNRWAKEETGKSCAFCSGLAGPPLKIKNKKTDRK